MLVRISSFSHALLLLLQLATPIHALPCGDDVDGRDVPCDCGDTVVSSVQLGNDPIAHRTCPQDGLIVYAPNQAHPMTIDLAGAVLRGQGEGTGIHVLHAGVGISIVSRNGMAQIEAFRDGIRAGSGNRVLLIDQVAVEGCRRDGIRLAGERTVLRMTDVRGMGRDGFSLRGDDWQLIDTRALDNGRFGFNVLGGRAQLGKPDSGPVAAGNGRDGFLVMGFAHQLTDCFAYDNAGDGVHLNGADFRIDGCVSRHNGRSPFSGNLGSHQFRGVVSSSVDAEALR